MFVFRFVVAIGGRLTASTEVLDLKKAKWTLVPSLKLPFGIMGHSVLSSKTYEDLLVIGGFDLMAEYKDTVFKMNLNGFKSKVELLPTKLSVPRAWFVALPVASTASFINCS